MDIGGDDSGLGNVPLAGVERFLKPDDIGTHMVATIGTVWWAGFWVPSESGDIDEGRIAVTVTEAFVAIDIAVNFDDLGATSTCMESVDILRDDGDSAFGRFERDQGVIAGVWLRIGHHVPAFLVPVPDQLGIAGEGTWRRELGHIEFGPVAGQGITEGGDTALF
jgi:hypothetical protein